MELQMAFDDEDSLSLFSSQMFVAVSIKDKYTFFRKEPYGVPNNMDIKVPLFITSEKCNCCIQPH